MKKEFFSKLVQYSRVSLSYAVYAASYLIPKQNNLWVFIGWRRSKEREIFAENTKYFFLHAHHEVKVVRPIWIGMDKKICKILTEQGYEAYPLKSFKGIFYSLRASHTILSGLLQLENWRLSGNSKLIQLWHGKSLKKTGHNSPYGLGRYDKFLNPQLFARIDTFVAISEFLSDFITQDFLIPRENILVSGIPKHDALLVTLPGHNIDVDNTLLTLLDTLKSNGARRIMLYGPTFRPDGSNPLGAIDLETLNKNLEANNDHCIISLHPKFSTRDWIPNVNLKQIHFIQGDMDRYPLMNRFDALITDYSSLSIDFLYMGKPTILYAYDYEKYGNDMGVYEELWSIIPGPKVFSFEDLITALAYKDGEYKEEIAIAQNKIFTFRDNQSSVRITKALLENESKG